MGQSFAQVYELDNSYAVGTGFNGEVNVIELDQNGEAYVGGAFTDYNGTTRNYLARLNADGTVDTGFDASTDLSSTIDDIALTNSATPFITVVTGGNIKRFYSGGSLFGLGDFLMRSTNNVIYTVAHAGSSLIFGGNFTDYDGNTVGRIGKMDSGGTPDATFITNTGTGFNGIVRTIEVTASGKILVGGDFTSFNGVARQKIALLNADGTLDTGFVPASLLSSSVYAVAMQADGKVLAGKPGVSSTLLFRFKTDGTEDLTFNNGLIPGTPSFIRSIYTNGTDDIIVGGWFDQGLVKLSYSNGFVTDIAAGNGIEGATKEINTLAVQGDGSVIIGGDFNYYNGNSLTNFARVSICGVLIDTQPFTTSACETFDTSFSVTATGTGTLSYQWQIHTGSGIGLYTDITDDATYTGALTSTLSVNNVAPAMDHYYYRCIVTDDNCSSTSDAVYLIVTSQQVITVNPVDQDVCEGGGASFFIGGTGPLGELQWQEDPGTGTFTDIANGGIYSGATSITFNISSVSSSMDSYKYRMVSTYCDVSSPNITTAATLTVNPLPEIMEQPILQAICVSGNTSFTVAATGSSLTYQWAYRMKGTTTYIDLSNGGVYGGTTTNTLTLTGASNVSIASELFDDDNTDGKTFAIYRCVVTSNGCDINTSNAYLNIHDAPTVTTDPADVEVCSTLSSGVNTSFSVAVSNLVAGFYYQWQVDDGSGFVDIVDDAIYSGSNTKDLALTDATPTLSGYLYRCEVGGCAPSVYSLAATLTIDAPPVFTVGAVQTNICEGSGAVFTVEATGTNLTYQWQEFKGTGSYTDISDNSMFLGTNSSTLQISGATTNMNNYRYKCVVTNGMCTLNSSNGVLKIYTQPTLTLYSNNQTTVCDGGTTTLRVTASSTSGFSAGVFSYQWQATDTGIFADISDGTTYSNTTAKVLSIDVATYSLNGVKYRCVINGCSIGNVSAEETLTVLQLPLVTTSPQSQTVCHGEQIKFTAEATGSDVTYTWWRDSGDGIFQQVSAANANPDLTFVANRDFNGHKYKCIAQAGNCTTTSESFEATLIVRETQITAVSTQSLGMCAGQTEAFSVTMSNTDGLTFQWSDANGALSDDDVYSGVTTSILTVTAPATAINNYSVAISGDCGNQSASYQLLVYGLETPVIEANFGDPANPQIFVNSSFTLGIDNFEWFLNGSTYQSTGGTASVGINQEGSYTVVANKNGCDHPESNAIVIVITGFENNLTKNAVSIYPNPVNNKLTLEMSKDFDTSKGSKIILTNTSGKQVYTKRYNNLYNRKVDIDMAGFESGIYIVSVINGDSIVQYKITKQ